MLRVHFPWYVFALSQEVINDCFIYLCDITGKIFYIMKNGVSVVPEVPCACQFVKGPSLK